MNEQSNDMGPPNVPRFVPYLAVLSSQIICPKCERATLRYGERGLLYCSICTAWFTCPKVEINEVVYREATSKTPE